MSEPDQTIILEPAQRRWRALFAGHVIADTDEAVILRGTGEPPRVYFPRRDVSMEYMTRSDRTAFSPGLGEPVFYTLLMDGQFAENGAWSYEDPIGALAGLAGRIAFITDQVEVYDVDDAAVNPHPRPTVPPEPRVVSGVNIEVDDVVLHTDSGSGASQRDRWAPNVERPDTTEDGGLV